METRSSARVVITVAAGGLVMAAMAVIGAVQAKKGFVAYQARIESLGDRDPAAPSSRVEVLSGQVAPTDSPGREASLRGEVLEGRTGLPIVDARVELETYGVSVRTDEDGRFEFLRLPVEGFCSLVTIEVHRSGYPRLRRGDVPLFPGDQWITVLLVSEEESSIIGRHDSTSSCGAASR